MKSPPWRVLLIGGGAAAGKTTSAIAIARRYGISYAPADGLWRALMRATSPTSHPALHHFEPSDDDLRLGAEELCRRHIETADAVSDALEAVIEEHMETGDSAVIEGAWITPAAALRFEVLYPHRAIRSVFIHEPDDDVVLRSMLSRSRQHRPSERKRIIARTCWLYGNWARDEATRLALPVVASRPLDTLVERIIAPAW